MTLSIVNFWGVLNLSVYINLNIAAGFRLLVCKLWSFNYKILFHKYKPYTYLCFMFKKLLGIHVQTITLWYGKQPV
jgi:hypothetical protein